MKLPVLILLFLCLPVYLYAQQQPQYSQYVINNYLINPAITGIEDYADVKLGYRNQWTGIQGSPSTLYLTGHTKFGRSTGTKPFHTSENKPVSFGVEQADYGTFRKVKPHHGVGGTILLDKIGPFAHTEISASYAYHIPVTANIRVSGGLSAGVVSQALRSDYLSFADAADVMATGWNKFSPNLSAGVWLYSSDFYLGASALQLFNNANSPDNNGKFTNHYVLTAAYKLQIIKNLAVIPSVLLKSMPDLPLAADYNVRAVFADRYWGGVSLRQQDGMAFLAGVTLNHYIDVSYAYEPGANSLSKESGGSHEVVLGIRLKNSNKIICPQNLW